MLYGMKIAILKTFPSFSSKRRKKTTLQNVFWPSYRAYLLLKFSCLCGYVNIQIIILFKSFPQNKLNPQILHAENQTKQRSNISIFLVSTFNGHALLNISIFLSIYSTFSRHVLSYNRLSQILNKNCYDLVNKNKLHIKVYPRITRKRH